MDKLTSIKIRQDNETYSDPIPVSVLAENVECNNGNYLIDILGNIDIQEKGNIQYQLNQLFNTKISVSELNNYVYNTLEQTVTNWLENNIESGDGSIVIDKSLSIEGAAADAKAVGDAISISASKRDVSPVLEIVEDVRRYPKDYTNPYTNWSTSGNYYGFWFEEVKYVESVTPFFRGDTGTGIVCIYTSDEPIALNGTVRKTEEWEITIGETIELNRIITPYDLVVIHGNENSALRYVKNSTDVPINARIAKISANADTATVTQTLEEHRFAGVFRIKEAHAPTDHLLFKKLMVIGDSMVYGHSLRPENSWPAIVGEDLGMSVDNRGTNGAFMADYRHGGKDSSVYQKLCVNGSEFYISTEELQSCYAVVVFAGTNDCNGSVTMGETNSTNPKEFFGALNLICQELQTRSPMAKIAFITPYLRAGIEERCQNYVNAILSICSKYSIPVFDNAKNGGICWTNESIVNMLTLNDTYHLNYNGMKYVAPKYENFIKSL